MARRMQWKVKINSLCADTQMASPSESVPQKEENNQDAYLLEKGKEIMTDSFKQVSLRHQINQTLITDSTPDGNATDPPVSAAVRCSSKGPSRHVYSSDWLGGRQPQLVWVPKGTRARADTHSALFLCSNSATAPELHHPPMANFPVNVVPYLPQGMTIELGPED